MAIHDYVISNANGAAVRQDLNDALAAIVSNNSNATAPTTTYAYQWWADTTNQVMKLRNAANTDWITLYQLDGEYTNITLEAGTNSAPSLRFVSDTNTGIYSPGADQVAITTGGTARLYVGSTGSVGIGTTSPNKPLHIYSGSSDSEIRLQTNSGTEQNAYLTLRNSGGNLDIYSANGAITLNPANVERARIDTSGRLLVGTTSDSGVAKLTVQGYIGSASGEAIISLRRDATPAAAGDTLGVINYYNSANSLGAQIFAVSDGAWTNGSSHPTYIGFGTCGSGTTTVTQRMRIDNAGNLLLNTASTTLGGDTANLVVKGFGASGYGIAVSKPANAGTSYLIKMIYDNTTSTGQISTTNTTVSYSTTSDYRLKENVTAVADGIIRLKQLNPSRFNFKAEPGKTVDGFIAHEVQDVVPEAITGEKDAVDDDGNPIYQGIDQSKLVPLLTAALQEAIGEIESLKARVAALESA